MLKEEETTSTTRTTYTAPAPDSSNITAVVEGGVATITYGGSALYIPVEALPVLTAISATAGAAIEPVQSDAPAPEAEAEEPQ